MTHGQRTGTDPRVGRLPFPAGWVAGVAALAVLLPAVPPRADDDPELEPAPFESEGDLAFFVDIARFVGPTPDRYDLEVYVAISNDQLVFEPEGSVVAGDLLLEIEMRDREDEPVAALETPLAPQAASELDAGDRAIIQVIRERIQVPAGLHRMQVRVTDRRSQKVGLLNRMRNVKKKGELDVWVEVQPIERDRLAASDLALVRSAQAADGVAAFGRNGVNFDPNPSRYYGLAVPSVRYYLEVYGGPGYQEG
ncbi:MAG TPA: hypothetical protein VKU85_18520, partial [bacterium]|nr:hypothetical protein [bacterium]